MCDNCFTLEILLTYSLTQEIDEMNALNQVAAALVSTDAPAAQAAGVYTLSEDVAASVAACGENLAQADQSFDEAIKAVATDVARIMGAEPTFDHWMAVSGRFQIGYVKARGCKPETAQKRWQAVTAAMEAEFALEKPAKPTKAAEVKAEQRKGAAAEAAALIEAAKAATPAEVLALSQSAEPLKAPVIAALAKAAGEMAAKAGADAAAKAKEESKALREQIRKGTQGLTVAQLRQVADLIESFKPKADDADETSDEEEGATTEG
jgi:hypothetical protein